MVWSTKILLKCPQICGYTSKFLLVTKNICVKTGEHYSPLWPGSGCHISWRVQVGGQGVVRSASWGSPGPRCLVPVWLCAADAAIVWFASKLSSPAPDMSAPSRSFVHFFFTVHLLHPPPWPGQPPPCPLRWPGKLKLTGYPSNTTCCPYFISLNESNLIL